MFCGRGLAGGLRALVVVGATGAGAGIGFVTALLIGRTFGPQDYGLFATLMATLALAVPLLSLGMDRLLLRYAARGAQQEVHQILGLSCRLVPVLCLALLPGLALWGSWAYGVDLLLTVLAGAWLPGMALYPIALGVFQARHRELAVAGWSLLAPVARLAAIGAAVVLGSSFAVFLGVFALAGLVVAGASLWVLLGYRSRLRTLRAAVAEGPQRVSGLRDRLIEGLPFAASAALFLVYYQIDVVMLAAMIETEAAGFYSVALLFLAAVYLPQQAFFQRFLLARIYRWWEQPGRVGRRLPQALAGVAPYAVVATVVLVAGAEYGVMLAFGDAYQAAVPVLAVLAWAVPFRLFAGTISAFLVTPDGIRSKVRAQLVVAVLNVLLNLWWIPALGITGAALATIVSEAVLLALYARAIRNVGVHWPALRRRPRPSARIG
ncbi:MAG: oligosaccharide flippase family protein [Halorhodospira halophila]|uniref:oligosaccharide flippase family protein n=1 Tax=Halorhodospira halophila TaxID=1053 RepID=UPI0026E966EF|nr:oligosaccharide flippase family protein [Halorhodospira halophila]MCC3751090.1 oligosaccharide flippase family protein [Halorhodospira halophila]